MKRLGLSVFVTVMTIFVPSTGWAACDLSKLNPETLLQMAALPREQAIQKLQSLCDEVRAEMIRLQAQADRAYLDPLTKLPNRHGIASRFDKRVSSPEHETFVAMLDIDHFKRVNDTFGHGQGDVVIAQVASEMQQIIADTLRTDDFAGRWGGEEFIIIFDAKDVVSALRIMTRLRMNIQQYVFNAIDLNGEQQFFKKTVSIGISQFADDQEGLAEVRERADKALYEAKKTRNLTIYFPPPAASCEGVIKDSALPGEDEIR